MSAIRQWRFVLFAVELGQMPDTELEAWAMQAIDPLASRMVRAELRRREALS